ncbi:hypothetical protein NESM_000088400 [Novymonas esmeraldas]|uniref:Uncharacterized protein n=1 Tax=Novymonas esmeraldas TaxID=1808958 RepID=A0AAW0F3Y4_9TRYP
MADALRTGAPRAASSSSSSSSSTTTAPPEGTATEQYHPVQQLRSAAAAMPSTSDQYALYHARAHSYASDVDGGDDEDSLTMPAPAHVRRRAAPAPTASSAQQRQHAALYQPSHLSSPDINSGPGGAVVAPAAPRTGIVRSSGYHYSLRTTAPPLAHEQQQQQQQQVGERLSPPPPPPSPPQRRSPYQSPPSRSNPTTATSAAAAATVSSPRSPPPPPLLLPAPPHSAASGTPHSSSPTVQWQLSSPRGVLIEYASEAVSTLEQQYGDALQRLRTMQRLYDRLDTHNRTLASEAERVRRVSDTLQSGVAYHLRNSVRQARHEMKLLRQYVELVCSGYGHQLYALQQVVAEELPRLLGRHDPFTSLLPYGAEGRLRPVETRVSISAAGPLERAGSEAASTGATGLAQLHSRTRWWDAVSPYPALSRPISLDDTGAEAEEETAGDADAGDGGPATAAAPPRRRLLDAAQDTFEDSRECDASRRACREAQTALAAAQRRVVELEQATSNLENSHESRIAQLKAAHRAKEATLREEIALLRRRVDLTHAEAPPSDGALVTGAAGGPVVPVDVRQLAQLLRDLHLQPTPAAEHPSGGSAAAPSPDSASQRRRRSATETAPRVPHAVHEDEEEEDVDDASDTITTTHSSSTSRARRHRAVAAHTWRSASTASTEEDDDEDEDAHRLVSRHGTLRDETRLGTVRDGGLHVPQRYSTVAAARRVERARRVLGCEPREDERQRQRGRESARGRPETPRSLAYDRLVGGTQRVGSHALTTERSTTAARSRSRQRVDADHYTSPQRRVGSPRHHHHGTGGVADPALLQSLLSQLAAMSAQGEPPRAAAAAAAPVQRSRQSLDVKAERVAQGLWAQKVLKERSAL